VVSKAGILSKKKSTLHSSKIIEVCDFLKKMMLATQRENFLNDLLHPSNSARI